MGAPMMDTGISAKDREAIAGEPTFDLLTQRLDIHEKNAWMLRSLLKK